MKTESSMTNGQMAQLVTLASEAIASAGIGKSQAQVLIGQGKRTKASLIETLARLAGIALIDLPLSMKELRALMEMFPKGRSFILSEICSLREVLGKFKRIKGSVDVLVPPQYYGDDIIPNCHVFVPNVDEWLLPNSTHKTITDQGVMVGDIEIPAGIRAEIGSVEEYCEILFQWYRLYGTFPSDLIEGKAIRTKSNQNHAGLSGGTYTIYLEKFAAPGNFRLVIDSHAGDLKYQGMGILPLLVRYSE